MRKNIISTKNLMPKKGNLSQNDCKKNQKKNFLIKKKTKQNNNKKMVWDRK